MVTADHETGGIVLGTGSYQLNLRVLENQRVSLEKLTREIRELRDMKSNQVEWENVQEVLAKNLGFWNMGEFINGRRTGLEKLLSRNILGQDR